MSYADSDGDTDRIHTKNNISAHSFGVGEEVGGDINIITC